MFLTQLFEAIDKRHAAFCFGRMNPPTLGHKQLADTVAKAAAGGDYFIFTSQTQDSKKNPLDYATKVKFIKAILPEHAGHVVYDPQLKTIMQVAQWLYAKGYRSVTFVAGSDRIEGFNELLKKYNGVKGPNGFYQFDTINIVSSGDRDPDADGVAGVSASAAREAASQGNLEAFAQATGAGKLAKPLYLAVRKGMLLEGSSTEFQDKLRSSVPKGKGLKNTEFQNIVARKDKKDTHCPSCGLHASDEAKGGKHGKFCNQTNESVEESWGYSPPRNIKREIEYEKKQKEKMAAYQAANPITPDTSKTQQRLLRISGFNKLSPEEQGRVAGRVDGYLARGLTFDQALVLAQKSPVEEVEQIDEISKELATRYYNKASGQALDAKQAKDNPLAFPSTKRKLQKTFDKRVAGMKAAGKRQSGEFSTTNEKTVDEGSERSLLKQVKPYCRSAWTSNGRLWVDCDPLQVKKISALLGVKPISGSIAGEYGFDLSITEDASGYIPKNKKEAKDPRWSNALTVDVHPDTPAKNAKALRLV